MNLAADPTEDSESVAMGVFDFTMFTSYYLNELQIYINNPKIQEKIIE